MSREETRRRILEATRSVIETESASAPVERVAEAAGVSRRAVYLHFASRTELLLALVAHVDETGELPERAARVWAAGSGVAALEEFVRLNARYNAEIAGVARALDESRRSDPAARAAWDDRMSGRRRACRRLVRWLERDGVLDEVWSVPSAADLVWALTNVPCWHDLVVARGWSNQRFERSVTRALRRALLAGG